MSLDVVFVGRPAVGGNERVSERRREMSLFQCDNCGAMDNTALADYYYEGDKKLCSECAFGTWHGKFRKIYLPKDEFRTDGKGNLEHIKTGRTDIESFEVDITKESERE